MRAPVRRAVGRISKEKYLEKLVQGRKSEAEVLLRRYAAFQLTANDVERDVDLLEDPAQVLERVLLPLVQFLLLRLRKIEGIWMPSCQENAICNHLEYLVQQRHIDDGLWCLVEHLERVQDPELLVEESEMRIRRRGLEQVQESIRRRPDLLVE